jgi:DNA-binding PadR family transcriptional regulator
MHPYRMQTLITQRGKEQIANVAQRNSVYQTIDHLCRAGLIEVRETTQHNRRPERTVYEATSQGRLTLRSWVRIGLSTVAREFPEFPAVLATLYGIEGPDDLALLIGARLEALQMRLATLERPVPGVPRLFLLEGEYLAAMVRAECKWLRQILADLQSERLSFPTKAEMLKIAANLGGPSPEALRKYTDELAASSLSGKTKRGKDKKLSLPASGAAASTKKTRKQARISKPLSRKRKAISAR